MKPPTGGPPSAGAPAGKKEAPKKEAKKDDEMDDLFGSDDEGDADAAKKAAEAAKASAKPKKEKPPEMSLIILEVKPLDDKTSLDVLAKRIFNDIKMEALYWKSADYKKVPVAYGIFKLIIGFSCEDKKVGVDDVIEKIEEF